MKMLRKDEGFTLIELMVVVLIIGILVAIAIPVFQAAKGNAQRRSCYANERTVEGALHSLEASTGQLPGATVTFDQIMTAGQWLNPGGTSDSYIATKPVCPAGGTYSWKSSDATIWCTGTGAHGHF